MPPREPIGSWLPPPLPDAALHRLAGDVTPARARTTPAGPAAPRPIPPHRGDPPGCPVAAGGRRGAPVPVRVRGGDGEGGQLLRGCRGALGSVRPGPRRAGPLPQRRARAPGPAQTLPVPAAGR